MGDKKSTKTCPECGTKLRYYDYFCGKCGHMFGIPKKLKVKEV